MITQGMVGRGIRAVVLANFQSQVSAPAVRDPQTAILNVYVRQVRGSLPR